MVMEIFATKKWIDQIEFEFVEQTEKKVHSIKGIEKNSAFEYAGYKQSQSEPKTVDKCITK